jgi:hypothetical protein
MPGDLICWAIFSSLSEETPRAACMLVDRRLPASIDRPSASMGRANARFRAARLVVDCGLPGISASSEL